MAMAAESKFKMSQERYDALVKELRTEVEN